jgi:hypothetical protein
MCVCVGFVRSRFLQGWIPCKRQAASGEVLCSEHRDALDSALLGIMEFEQVYELRKHLKAKAEIDSTYAGHTKRRGGKNDALTARPGPGGRVSRTHSTKGGARVQRRTKRVRVSQVRNGPIEMTAITECVGAAVCGATFEVL